MKRKPGPKPKGGRPLTAVEKTQRYRARLKILAEELDKAGAKPATVFMPPIYMQAMRAYEAGLQAQPDMVNVVALSSGWVCAAIEDFLKRAVEIQPDSEVARIYHSDEWIPSDRLPFEVAALKAKIRIHDFEQQHEKELHNDIPQHQ